MAFGGGFVSLSLIKEIFVEKYSFLSKEELIDVNSIAQASPGSIALNSSLIIGYKVAGFFGAVATCIASIIPPILIISALYFFYDAIKNLQVINYIMKGMQAGVAAVIISLSTELWKDTLKKGEVFEILLLIVSFILSFLSIFLFNVSIVIYIVILSAVLGIAVTYISWWSKKRK